MTLAFPVSYRALPVQQNLGLCYVTVIPARVLLEVACSQAAKAYINEEGTGYVLDGNQRFIKDERLRQIADYIRRADSAFPNAIILAVNIPLEAASDAQIVDADRSEEPDDQPTDWSVFEREDGSWWIDIPSSEKVAVVVDGQHRLFSFAQPEAAAELDTPLICSVFFDINKPIQAQLFATINSTQKRVDKSLTYELFGYNVEEEAPAVWTPEKLAVFLTRRLNVEEGSPLRGRIIVAPRRDRALTELASKDWLVSTAVVVEGIMRLFSGNPRRDSNRMLQPAGSTRAILSNGSVDRSPLRDVFIEGSDKLIYIMVRNYLSACDEIFWTRAKAGSFIVKTVGVQALFDVLRHLAKKMLEGGNLKPEVFADHLAPAQGIDFSTDAFRSPSGSGRSAIRRAIEEKIGLP